MTIATRYEAGFLDMTQVKKESVPGTLELPSYSGADAFGHIDFVCTLKKNLVPDARHNDRRETDSTNEGKRQIALSFSMNAIGGGAATTKPDYFEIIEAFFDDGVGGAGDTTATAAAHTTTTITVTSITGFVVNQGIGVVISGVYQHGVIKTIAGAVVTLYTALTAAPATGALVKGGYGYPLVKDPQDRLTFVLYEQQRADYIEGGIITGMTFTVDGDQDVVIQCQGIAGDIYEVGSSLVAGGGIDGVGATALTVTTGEGFRFTGIDSLTAKGVLLIESEYLSLSAKTAANVTTVVREVGGSSQAAHAAGVNIEPFRPTPTYNSSGGYVIPPVNSSNCILYISGERFEHIKTEVAIGSMVKPVHNAAGRKTNQGYHATMLDPTVNITLDGWTPAVQTLYGQWLNKTIFDFKLQMGIDLGKMMGLMRS